jgi:hypothetical protein
MQAVNALPSKPILSQYHIHENFYPIIKKEDATIGHTFLQQ